MSVLLQVTANLDIDPWKDLQGQPLAHTGADGPVLVQRIGVLPNHTSKGRAGVAFQITLPDGKVVIAETTLRVFLAAAQLISKSPVALMEDM